MSHKIAILGAGESGVGAAILAQKKGMETFLSDSGKIKEKYAQVLSNTGIAYEEGKHSADRILGADEIVKSPGIPETAPLIKQAVAKGIPVISEIEFAARYTSAKKICITGSNGKTTTTLLTYHILKNAGLNVGLAGNVGKSFAQQVAENDFDWYVLEISSFQLDNMYDFKAEIAILTNITPDHLDRYNHDFSLYTDSKFRIIRNQTGNDAFICNLDDEVTAAELTRRKISARQYPFSYAYIPGVSTAFVNENKLTITINNDPFTMTLEELALQGRHNIYNSMAASIAARLTDIRKESIKQSLSDFQNVEHRLEHVARIHGIEFINDSKATNVNSTWFALESIDKPAIWIAGGVDKGNDYSKLFDLVKEKVKALICLGVDNTPIIEAFADKVGAIYETRSAEQAVMQAYTIAKTGDVVLLSPACASFDLFENYEDRGEQFKKAVRGL
ncbi:MAG TPA: UDP-N-acetylmuramoyl-L-alanine--D-glutamate ligase [Bacteroidales bacterium]|jgi:UDP-N-acetylmuramoylalanine--D-glutamate ligase|nr:UDP-N-acetylmuramoyl-L-alanine--D-glutamate ligase [Bacteroidales bacterium]